MKGVVIGLGVLIVAALGVIIVTIASRLESHKAIVATAAGASYGVKNVDIPVGARIVRVRVVGQRLLFDISGPGPTRALMVYDLDTGQRLGTIEWKTPGE